MKKIDYAIAGLIGFFAGIFAIPVVYNLYNPLSGVLRHGRNPFVLLSLPWVFAIAALIGMFVLGLLGRKVSFFNQFAKFAVVGVLNTAIDFGILNIVVIITGVTGSDLSYMVLQRLNIPLVSQLLPDSWIIGIVNVPGVVLALVNAYFWNKFWVFGNRDNKGIVHNLPTFLLVSGIGVVINSGIVILATSYPVTFVNAKTWLNIAKLFATVFSLAWNFVGYKFIVFKSEEMEPTRELIAPL